jgi:2-polyprenyl-3-methyl-5-hydroxy-6-metoxy-1,4-benzoquinol methylase
VKVQALPEAIEIWKNPGTMFQDWRLSFDKQRMEQEISNLVGTVNDVADLGCGPGRYADILHCLTYHGFDAHESMMQYEMKLPGFPTFMQARFFKKDVFSTGRKHRYDVVLMIDVLQHQEDPVAALQQMLSLWNANRYIFTILVGQEPERLLNSMVAAMAQVTAALSGRRTTYIKDFQVGDENFVSTLYEVRP